MKTFKFSWNLTNRILVAAGVLVLLASSTVEVYFMHNERAALERRLKEKMDFINKFYVNSIADSLEAQDDVRLLQDINRLEEDTEITSVIVVDDHGDIRYHSDPEKMGTHLEDPFVADALKTGEGAIHRIMNSGGKAMALVCPFRKKGRMTPIGAVRMDLTYQAIDKQIDAAQTNYFVFLLGLLTFCIGAVRVCAQRWVLGPLGGIQKIITGLNPATMEPNLPESPDEFGQILKSLNDMILRIRMEVQTHTSLSADTENRERRLVENVASLLGSDQRLLVVDRDNRLVADTHRPGPSPVQKPHLLDLITDNDFATLVGNAFQKEGATMSGSVQFDGKSYDATVLRIPAAQSITVRTLIALKPK
jgi:hypothetical protein